MKILQKLFLLLAATLISVSAFAEPDFVCLADDNPCELPEPGAFALLGLGLVALAVTRLRKK